jgi:hypothetical protein
MGKSASKNFVNQFKNTRRQASQTGRRPLGGLAGRRPLVGPTRHSKKPLPGERKNEKNTNRGYK